MPMSALQKESAQHLVQGRALQTLVALDGWNQRMAINKAFPLENQSSCPTGVRHGCGLLCEAALRKAWAVVIRQNWRRRMVYLASGAPPNEEHGQPARKGGLIVRRVGPAEGQRPVAAAVARRPLHIAALAQKRSTKTQALTTAVNLPLGGGSPLLRSWCNKP